MYQLNVFVHILSALVWVGGMFFVALVVVPVTRPLAPTQRGALLDAVGRRFRLIGWICIALLIVTGVINAGFRGVTWDSVFSGQVFGSQFGQVLAAKLVMVALMLVLSAIHDFVLGPASTRALEHPGLVSTHEVASLRQRASWIARVNALLALVVLFLAVALVRGLPW